MKKRLPEAGRRTCSMEVRGNQVMHPSLMLVEPLAAKSAPDTGAAYTTLQAPELRVRTDVPTPLRLDHSAAAAAAAAPVNCGPRSAATA